MRVAVLCESSGRVRDAFRLRGHDAVSCDLEPSETEGSHILGDVRDHDWSAYDLVIAFPPCRYLAVSGARWWRGREREQAKALEFVLWLLALPVSRIALENPVGHISTAIRRPDQIIQPWMFGEPEAKATCLWLKGLPPLRPTNVLVPRGGDVKRGWDNQTPSGQNKLGPGPNRARERARTYRGIAAAMAEQWGGKDAN